MVREHEKGSKEKKHLLSEEITLSLGIAEIHEARFPGAAPMQLFELIIALLSDKHVPRYSVHMQRDSNRSPQRLGIMLLVLCIGTIFDWFAHQASPSFGVPSSYFRNKILFGTIIGFVALEILRKFVRSDRWLAFGSTLTIAILLQTRYYMEGYDLNFVFLFMGIHFVVFFLPALVLFHFFKKIL